MGTTHQRGYVTPRGKQWYGYYRKAVNDSTSDEQKTVRVPVILGLKSKMSKFEAREALQRELTKQVGQPGSPTRVMNDGSVTFSWFVKNRFLPLKEAVWKGETAKTKTILIQSDLIDPLGEIPLANFDKFSLQLHLNKLATTRYNLKITPIPSPLLFQCCQYRHRSHWLNRSLGSHRYRYRRIFWPWPRDDSCPRKCGGYRYC